MTTRRLTTITLMALLGLLAISGGSSAKSVVADNASQDIEITGLNFKFPLLDFRVQKGLRQI